MVMALCCLLVWPPCQPSTPFRQRSICSRQPGDQLGCEGSPKNGLASRGLGSSVLQRAGSASNALTPKWLCKEQLYTQQQM